MPLQQVYYTSNTYYIVIIWQIVRVFTVVSVTIAYQLITRPEMKALVFTPLTRLCYVGTFALSRDNGL